MMLIPPHDEYQDGPLIFLAGPVQGTWPWQDAAYESIMEQATHPNLRVANPRGDYAEGEFDHARQVDWETRHLLKAAQTGAILFWLARERQHICSRAYAQTTRFELAEWVTKAKQDHVLEIVVGMEEGFTGGEYICHRLAANLIPIHRTMESTCAAAVRVAEQWTK